MQKFHVLGLFHTDASIREHSRQTTGAYVVRSHWRECSCTLALSTKCSRIHASSWRSRLLIDNQY